MDLSPISADEIMTGLRTEEIGSSIVYRPVMTSTMDVALGEIAAEAPSGTTVICEIQDKGKARLDRQWLSPLGGVYISIILYPPQELLASLTMLASLAVVDAIREVCNIEARIKWPNDVLVGDKKVSGIMAQSGQSEMGDFYAVVGIGVNANMDMAEQAEIAAIATSLSAVTGGEVSRQAFIISLLENFEKRYMALQSGEKVWEDWQKLLVTLGKFVTARSGRSQWEGLAEGG